MNRIDRVDIKDFWGDKTVVLKFKDDVNFLIGVNGSGKTTIINLIAATLKADFATLDRIEFSSIQITLKNEKKTTASNSFIKVEKKERKNIPFPKIEYRILDTEGQDAQNYSLSDLEEEVLLRQPRYTQARTHLLGSQQFGKDLVKKLQSLVNVSWLSIHRTTDFVKRTEDRSFESSVDLKIEQLQIELIKYFSKLQKKYADVTIDFQRFYFESLINPIGKNPLATIFDINPTTELNFLQQIFVLFGLNDSAVSNKLHNYFETFTEALDRFRENKNMLSIQHVSYLMNTVKIHSVVEEWNKVLERQKEIDKPKNAFLNVVNSLLQRKEIHINEKNELVVVTQSGKQFQLTNLSSGEKQLLIILGQSLLQEDNLHVYIADEPELSLHVEWQEKLVASLKSLNANSQIIFATHSPDIVGEFGNAILQVEKCIR